jgi:hypothetical protein
MDQSSLRPLLLDGHRQNGRDQFDPHVIPHRPHQPYRIGITVVLDEAEAHVRVPAKIAIDFFKMSRSIRSRSFSWRSRAISEAWSAGIGVACVRALDQKRAVREGSPR